MPEEYERREEIQETAHQGCGFQAVSCRGYGTAVRGNYSRCAGIYRQDCWGIQEAAEAAEQARSQAQERFLNRAEQLQQAYQQLRRRKLCCSNAKKERRRDAETGTADTDNPECMGDF